MTKDDTAGVERFCNLPCAGEINRVQQWVNSVDQR
jgi:hypothetical protein